MILELFVNDLSIHGQFPNVASFDRAIADLMAMRNLAKRYGRELFCHRNVSSSQVTRDMKMQQAVQCLQKDQTRALMSWFTREGPYWEDDQHHSSDDYLECLGRVVTDSAVGEAAFRCFWSFDSRLISLNPSDWTFSPLDVWWRSTSENDRKIEINNYFNREAFENLLRASPLPVASWDDLEAMSRRQFGRLLFDDKAFEPLGPLPFNANAAQRIQRLLEILHKINSYTNSDGKRNDQGNELYQQYFTGKKSLFSDSSDSEKDDFKQDLTFKHPEKYGKTLFCSWHGKVKTYQIRIHFSWPEQAGSPFHIVYIGPKITKR
ncbi:MAG: hypothetical protein HQL76_14880 [Magnetococcales bacterium]|nr:hypothetical protein [Magnetococcales bacterium]